MKHKGKIPRGNKVRSAQNSDRYGWNGKIFKPDVCIIGDKYCEHVRFKKTSEHDSPECYLAGGIWFVRRFLDKVLNPNKLTHSIWAHNESEFSEKTSATVHLYQEYALPSLANARPDELSDISRVVIRLDETDYHKPDEMSFDDSAANVFPQKLLVIEDMDLGYRTKGKQEWESMLHKLKEAKRKNSGKNDICTKIILLLGGELPYKGTSDGAEMWDLLEFEHSDDTIVIVNADLLRFMGANISRRTSWERTSQDLITQLNTNERIGRLKNFSHVIVRFGVTAAVHYARDDAGGEFELYYDARSHDGLFRYIKTHGGVIGNNSVFTACIAKHILATHPPMIRNSINDGIRESIPACQRLFLHGYPHSPAQGAAWPGDWPRASIFAEGSGKSTSEYSKNSPTFKEFVRMVNVPKGSDSWNILHQNVAGRSLTELAIHLVFFGINRIFEIQGVDGRSKLNKISKCNAPLAKFGELTVLERDEIENFRGVFNLMKQYVSSDEKRPLCISLFGPPGSGKSFTVDQLIKELACDNLTKIQVNMAQVSSVDRLNAFLIDNLPNRQISAAELQRGDKKVDDVLLIFFDEFDSEFGGHLGWLKCFLAPMEDGTIGPASSRGGSGPEGFITLKRSILVFAGGTKKSYSEFACESANITDEQKLRFELAKGPDFTSRLRGHIDIKGINREGASDTLYVLRRAVLLRVYIEQLGFVNEGDAQIDYALIYAMLKIRHYKHGARSMRSVLTMCIPLLKRVEKASLPSDSLLDMHVDVIEFKSLLADFKPSEDDPRPRFRKFTLS